MARVEPTDADLQQAWQERKRADWPATFDEVMQDPMLCRLVRMHACHAAITRRIQRPRAEAPAPAQMRNLAPRVAPIDIPLVHQPALFDRKRAAAGDRDD
jgi:hypothetical protein